MEQTTPVLMTQIEDNSKPKDESSTDHTQESEESDVGNNRNAQLEQTELDSTVANFQPGEDDSDYRVQKSPFGRTAKCYKGSQRSVHRNSFSNKLSEIESEGTIEDKLSYDDGNDEMSDGDVSCLSDQEQEEFVVHDSDYDTDLEGMNHDKWIYPEKYEHDTSGIVRYERACREEGVEPIRYFARHIQDVHLKLRHHGLGPAAVRALSAPLETSTTIEQIDLEGNWIMSEGTFHLCRVLRDNVFLTELNLAENKIDSEGAVAVCQMLMHNKSIERLNISGNDIGGSAAESFYTLLTEKSAALKQLNLRHNKFEDDSAHFFKDILTENETLEVFDLSWNRFQCRGCCKIADGLKENFGLKDLCLSMNGFGHDGGKKLGEALQVNRTLIRLDVSYCRLSKANAHDLAHGLHHNDNLQYLDVSNNYIHDDGAYEMLCATDQNEASRLKFLNLGTTIVHDEFKQLEDKLLHERQLEVIHGGVGYKVMEEKLYDPMEAFKRDPMTKLKEWVAQAGYRLIDLLRHFDKDQSNTISHEEFKTGIKAVKIPITDEQMGILISRLDTDGDGEIDFKELIDGDKDHRKTFRDISKLLVEREEQNREERVGSFADVVTSLRKKSVI